MKAVISCLTLAINTYEKVAQTKTKQASKPLREIVPNTNSYSCSCEIVELFLEFVEPEVESSFRFYPHSNYLAGALGDEQWKYAILLAATILSARKPMESMEEDKPNMAKDYIVDKAIDDVAFILERIDRRWPSKAAAD